MQQWPEKPVAWWTKSAIQALSPLAGNIDRRLPGMVFTGVPAENFTIDVDRRAELNIILPQSCDFSSHFPNDFCQFPVCIERTKFVVCPGRLSLSVPHSVSRRTLHVLRQQKRCSTRVHNAMPQAQFCDHEHTSAASSINE